MILPCDFRIAVEGAKIGLTFVKLGILAGLGSTHLLPKIVGRANAIDLLMTGRIVKAPEAKDLGLVNRVVAAEDLMAAARDLATSFADSRPEVVAAAKRAVAFGEDHTMAAAMKNEERVSAELRQKRENA